MLTESAPKNKINTKTRTQTYINKHEETLIIMLFNTIPLLNSFIRVFAGSTNSLVQADAGKIVLH